MHEMTLMAGLLEIIEDQARQEAFAQVTRVVLEIGDFAGVEKDAMRFAFEVGTQGTLAEGAELVIEEVPGRARCRECGHEAQVAAFFDPCPACGAVRLEILAGRELRVVSLDVA